MCALRSEGVGVARGVQIHNKATIRCLTEEHEREILEPSIICEAIPQNIARHFGTNAERNDDCRASAIPRQT